MKEKVNDIPEKFNPSTNSQHRSARSQFGKRIRNRISGATPLARGSGHQNVNEEDDVKEPVHIKENVEEEIIIE